MEMCFHGNRPSWGIKHPIISLWSKYHSPGIICLFIMLAPVISSLDEIYCTICLLSMIVSGRYRRLRVAAIADCEWLLPSIVSGRYHQL